MTVKYRMLFGPVAAVIFAAGILGLPQMIPGYSQVHQTVSEIGEVGSPARVPFTLMMLAVATCILIFASALREVSRGLRHSPLPAYLTVCMALSTGGVGVFAYPNPLHNYFGLSELIGYQAPLALAFSWRHDRRVRTPFALSCVMSVLMWVVIVLNLSVFDRNGALWAYERPFYGLLQRALFATWFLWCAAFGLMIFLARWEDPTDAAIRSVVAIKRD